VAVPDAVLGFGDIALGLVPAAGGTQRLPRLVGGAEALRMLLGGPDVPAVQALATGLVDHIATGDPLAEARRVAARKDWPERRGLRDGRGYLAAIAEARKVAGTGAGGAGAGARMVDCVEMAVMLPLAQGLAYERVCFEDLAVSEASVGLRHAAAAFAQAGGGAGVAVARVGIWGAGAAAVDLVLASLQAGLVVQLAAETREAVVRALADVAERQEAAVQAGSLPPERREDDWARLLPQVGMAGLAGVDLAVLTEEAGVEEEAGGPRLAYGIAATAGAVGLARFDRLAELHAGGAAPDHVARASGFARALGWEPVVTQGAVALRLAAVLSDAVLHAEANGVPRGAIARSLAAQGIAGEGARSGGAADETALRCLAALANAGARAIEAGDALSAAHVDAVAIAAGLMARRTGGPMHQANRRGLLLLRRDLRLWAEENPALWSPARLIETLAAEGQGFS
jgi:3-hydroxyacyl-CoA dehydrogenase